MIPLSKCPNCKHELYDSAPERMPQKGDLAVCIYCGEILEFDEHLYLTPTLKRDEETLEGQSIVKFMLSHNMDVEKIFKEALKQSQEKVRKLH